MNLSNLCLRLTTLILLSVPTTAFAAKLELSAETPAVWHLGANFILYMHIIGGGLGLLSGLVASLSKKGSLIHRNSGKIFLVSMLVCYGIGAAVAPFLNEGQRVNFVAAILALYLLVSGVQAVKLRSYTASKFNLVGLLLSTSIAVLGFVFMYMGSQSESGTVDGSPPDAFLLFVIAGSLSAIGEARILIIKKLSAQGRLYRHLWRMCFSFFIASGSLFSGQIQMFPDWFANSFLPILCSLFPLLVLWYWTIKMLFQISKRQFSRLKFRSEAKA